MSKYIMKKSCLFWILTVTLRMDVTISEESYCIPLSGSRSVSFPTQNVRVVRYPDTSEDNLFAMTRKLFDTSLHYFSILDGASASNDCAGTTMVFMDYQDFLKWNRARNESTHCAQETYSFILVSDSFKLEPVTEPLVYSRNTLIVQCFRDLFELDSEGHWSKLCSYTDAKPCPTVKRWRARRRQQLSSLHLRVAVINYPPLVMYNQTDLSVIPWGYFPDVFMAIQRVYNFTYSFVPAEEGKWGALKGDNVSFDGMVGQLQRREVDLSIGVIDATLVRLVTLTLRLVGELITALLFHQIEGC